MKLEFQKWKQALSGAVYSQQEGEKVSLFRFSKEQLAFLAPDEVRRIRSYASAGMKLDFRTDSRSFALWYEAYQASSQQSYFFDVMVDGVLRLHCGKCGTSADEGVLQMELPEGEKRVTVYFPCLFGVNIAGMELSDGANFEPVKKERNLLFFGDSITQGYTAKYPSLSYPNLIGAHLNANVLNQAIGGEIFNADNLDGLPEFPADTVFVAYGTNDWSSKADLPTAAGKYYEKLAHLYPEAKICAMLPIWRKGTEELEREGRIPFEQARRQIAEVCRPHRNITVLETIDYVPHFEEFFEDRVLHPNELGFLFMAEHLLRAIDEQ